MKEIEVMYEDQAMVAINKPAGLLVHASHVSEEEPTVVDWFIEQYPDSKDVGETQTLADGSVIERPGVVHRLDKDTSGVLVLAKTADAYAHLKEQFQERALQKTYLALVYGIVEAQEWSIDRSISKHTKDFRRFTSRTGRGVEREALTQVHVLERFEKYSLLEVMPKTGRTHQIRVHLADEGYPVVCDQLYGRGRVCPLGELSRQALHAKKIQLVSPESGEMVEIEAPTPPDMASAIASL